MVAEIRPIRPDESDEFLATLAVAAGRSVEAADAFATQLGAVSLAAFDGGRMVGATGMEPVELTVPGAVPVPAGKIGLTGLLPTHRGRGIAGALIRRQLHDLYHQGMPLAVVTAAESHVPGRHGFSVATRAMSVTVDTRRPGYRPPDRDMMAADRAVDLIPRAAAEDTLPLVYDRHRRNQVGQVSRSAPFWAGWFADRPALRAVPGDRGSPGDRVFAAAYGGSGAVEGYLSYRLAGGPLRERPVAALVVEDLIAVTDQARRALWAFCAGFGQAPELTAWNLPVDEPAGWLLPDPRDLRVYAVRPFLRLRLVDVPAALQARRYLVPDVLVLEVDDPVLPANTGRFRLAGGSAEVHCNRCAGPADLSLSVADLAAVYLGDTDLLTLGRAGRVRELSPGALARGSLLFSSRPAPWTVTDW
jgi:predicted acetyltransferase